MSCFKGDKGKKAVVAFTILVLIQLSFVIGLLVLGVKGKEAIGTKRGAGVPYYVGAFVVGGVFAVPVLQIIAVIILTSCEEEYCITSCFMISSCVLNFFGIIACILGMIFVIAFGIANCKKDPDSDYTDTGFCSYSTNIDTNYTIAVLALVLILFMLMSTCFTFCMMSKYSDALMSRNESSSEVAPSSLTQGTSQAFRTHGGPGPPGHPAPSAPPLYSQNPILSDPAYPPNLGRQGGTEEPPPSYESVMAYGGATTSTANQSSSQPRTNSYPATQQLSLSEEMSRDTQRRMREDRVRRLDEQRQRRMGVPENRIMRKFIGKFGF